MANETCRHACAMYELQIRELSGRLSDDAKRRNHMIPWHEIHVVRNMLAHWYGDTDWDMIWNTVTDGFPVLKFVCERHIKEK